MVTKGRKLLAVVLFLGIALLAVFMTGFVSRADTDQGYELTTIKEETLYTTPTSPKKVNVLIFGHVTCGNTMNTLGFLGEQDWLDDPEIGISFVDLLDSPKEDVFEFSKGFSSKFNYCYSKEQFRNQMIAKGLNNGELGSLPIIVYVDAEGTVRKVTHGMQYGEPIYSNICEILGRDADTCISVHFDGKVLATEARKELAIINDFRANDAWYYNMDGNISEVGGLGDLIYDYDLEKVAIQRAKEIVVNFDHQRPNADTALSAFPDGYSSKGENIAAGQSTAEAVMEAWKETNEDYYGQGHRRNMLGSFNAVGMACVEVNGRRFWVQEFGYKTASTINTTPHSYSETAETYTVELAKSMYKPEDITYPSGTITVNVDKSVAAPTLPYLKGTFDIPVYLSSTTRIEDADIAELSDGKITGLNHGKTKLTITTRYLPKETRDTEMAITVKGYEIGNAEVTLSASKLTFNGKAQKPALKSVKVGGKELKAGTDYTVEWGNASSKNVGTYAYTLKGIGKYTGTKKGTYQIKVKAVTPTVKLSKDSVVYNGKAQKPGVTVQDGTTKLTTASYTVSYDGAFKNAGTYKVIVKLKGNYSGSKTVTFKITKKANPLKVKAKSATVSLAKVKKSAQKLAATGVIAFQKKGEGSMAYAKVSGNSKIKINKTTGQVTVAKGLAKGTYAVKIKLKAKGNANFQASKVIPLTFKIVVK